MSSRAKAVRALRVIQEKVSEQSDDDDLWFRANSHREKALQKAIKDLHDTIERFTIPLFEKLQIVEDEESDEPLRVI